MYFVMIVDVEDMFGRMSTNSGSTPFSVSDSW